MARDYTAAALRPGSRLAKAAGSSFVQKGPSMSAIAMIIVFLLVFLGLNVFEFGRPD